MAESDTTTVSVRITTEERLKMRKLGIKPAKVLKRALEREIRIKEIEALMQKAKQMHKTFTKLPIETVVASIREDRDAR
ncbi:MAG: hypothetical protein KGH94_03180 [Candidatus Micrarchaeota archaeon]|nr:hypothetical protein [Candidatus Micrarchaeota archaeon]